jgi:glucuronate isomerase
MRLPLNIASAPLTGKEAHRLIDAVNAGRAVTNTRAKAFAAEIVAEMHGDSAKRRKLRKTRHP